MPARENSSMKFTSHSSLIKFSNQVENELSSAIPSLELVRKYHAGQFTTVVRSLSVSLHMIFMDLITTPILNL